MVLSITAINSQQDVHKSLLVQWEPTWDILNTTDEAFRNYKPSFTYVHTCLVCNRYRMQVHPGWDARVVDVLAKRQTASVSDNRDGSVLLLLLLLSRQRSSPFGIYLPLSKDRSSTGALLYRSRTLPEGVFRVRRTVMLTVYWCHRYFVFNIKLLFDILKFYILPRITLSANQSIQKPANTTERYIDYYRKPL